MIRKSNVAAGPLPNMKMSGVLVADAPKGAAAAMTRNTSAMPPMAPCLSWLLWPDPLLSHNGNLLLLLPLLASKEIPNVELRRSRPAAPGDVVPGHIPKRELPPMQQAIRDFSCEKSVYHFHQAIDRDFKSSNTYERQGPHARRRTAAPTARPTRDPVDGHGRSMPPRVCTRNQPDAHHPCPALRAHSARHAVRRLERVRHAPSWVSGEWPLFLVLNEL